MHLKSLSLLFFSFLFLCLFCHCKKSSNDSSGGNNTTPPTSTTPPPDKPYQLVWADEFDSAGLPDSTKWGYDTGGSGWGNNELEYYTSDRMENARVDSGNLIIEARNESYGGKNYTSARLVTRKKEQWTYGKFEIRAKIPSGVGTWPAIWLLSATDPLVWPDDGELDIMEEVGFNPNVIYGTAHCKAYNGAQGTQKGSNIAVPSAQSEFHVYTLEWTPTSVAWYVDSTNYFIYGPPNFSFDYWPYTSDFYLILNIAIGGNWGGQKGVDNSIFPQQMLVDYVRVYQKK
ncbi:MAG TPA: glycoside hydrolase family 16 protein [Puia sp.]|nr:glycoside hydrolase family 16 protein [Puia sp.]